MWMVEAQRIATSAQTKMGDPDNGEAKSGSAKWRDPTTHYILTGSPMWNLATKSERRAVIEAFGTNQKLSTVSMSDSMIDDDLARSWASVLACPTCVILSLSLESNPISSAGIEAIASALPSNSSLRELKLRNLHGKVHKEAEEALAEAIERHYHLTKLYVDFKSYRARDLVAKYTSINEKRRRDANGWSAPIAAAGLWDPNFKPDLIKTSSSFAASKTGSGSIWRQSSVKLGKVHAPSKGKHVSMARQLWDGFVGGTGSSNTELTTPSGASAAANSSLFSEPSSPGWGEGSSPSRKSMAYDPALLPINTTAVVASQHGELPYVSLASVTRGKAGLPATALTTGAFEQENGDAADNDSTSDNDTPVAYRARAAKAIAASSGSAPAVAGSMQDAVAEAAAKKRASMVAAVAELEHKRSLVTIQTLAKDGTELEQQGQQAIAKAAEVMKADRSARDAVQKAAATEELATSQNSHAAAKSRNPLAFAASEAAARREAGVTKALTALEERKDKEEQEARESRMLSQRLAHMLESTGQLLSHTSDIVMNPLAKEDQREYGSAMSRRRISKMPPKQETITPAMAMMEALRVRRSEVLGEMEA